MNNSYLIDFRLPATADELAPYLGVEPARLEEMLASKDRRKFYRHHRIPKKSSRRSAEFRDVWETGVFEYFDLIDAHKVFARRFDLFLRLMTPQFPHSAAFGYVRHRGTLENAGLHAGAPLLLKADIKDFFPSISVQRLIDNFKKTGMQAHAATALAKFATIDDKLPLGLNASPMLANLVCWQLDDALQAVARAHGCNYSRYADDISISGSGVPDRAAIENILVAHGFALNARKFRITKRGQAHYVTGLSISERSGPRAPKKMKRQLRQELYYANKFGIEDHIDRANRDPSFQAGINRLDGTVNYIHHIEKSHNEPFKRAWKALAAREEVEPSYSSRSERAGRFVTCYIDESEFAFRNKRYLALAFVFTEDTTSIAASTNAVLRKHILDPFYAGDKDALAKNGIHFADAHFDLRAAYIELMEKTPLRAFVAFAQINASEDYEATYLRLMKELLPQRLVYYDGSAMRIVAEENSSVSSAKLVKAVEDMYGELEAGDARRPRTIPEVLIAGKDDNPLLALPDFILGVFFRYAQANEKSGEPLRIHQFERLRDKYRIIRDVDTGTEYGRRNPFVPWDAN